MTATVTDDPVVVPPPAMVDLTEDDGQLATAVTLARARVLYKLFLFFFYLCKFSFYLMKWLPKNASS
jgi:hypothetical protein